MEKAIYLKTAISEDIHWWFIGRRFIIEEILNELPLPSPAEILEMGCGSGGNLELLARYGNIYGVELDDQAREYANNRNIGIIVSGSLPDKIPFSGEIFDLIIMTDVLEHVEQDQLSLERLHSNLKPGGYILITVPAFRALWSTHDDLHHHKRRYNMLELRNILINAHYDIVKISYFNCILFPIIVVIRIIKRILRMPESDDLSLYSTFINRLLTKLFSSEVYLLKLVSLPFGVSLLCVGQKV